MLQKVINRDDSTVTVKCKGSSFFNYDESMVKRSCSEETYSLNLMPFENVISAEKKKKICKSAFRKTA